MKAYMVLTFFLVTVAILPAAYCQVTVNDSVVIACKANPELKGIFDVAVGKANESAVRLSKNSNLYLDYFNVYQDCDKTPVTAIFEYSYTASGNPCWMTVAISLQTGSPLTEYYYFSKTIEKEWFKSIGGYGGQDFIVCSSGTYLKKNENEYLKIPASVQKHNGSNVHISRVPSTSTMTETPTLQKRATGLLSISSKMTVTA